MTDRKVISTDILVVGGGMAAMFASIKAKEKGADITLVDKGYAGKSGQSPYADGFTYIDPEGDGSLDGDMARVSRLGEYLNNREWCRMCFSESYDRLKDLLDMGVEFFRDEKGELLRIGPPGGSMAGANIRGIKSINTIRKYAEKIGVNIVDKVMVTDLLKNSGKIVGATGVKADDASFFVFRAKAVILCTGGSGFKPTGWPIHELTSDGDAMAYRAGAEITGKEFVDTHGGPAENPSYMNFSDKFSKPKSRPPMKKVSGANGEAPQNIGTLSLHADFMIHEGNGPIVMEMVDGTKRTLTGGTSAGMSVHRGEGIWGKGYNCETYIDGLFAAGDALGSPQAGAAYPGGIALAGAAVTGARAGVSACEYISDKSHEDGLDKQIDEIEEWIFAPLKRKGGFGPRWVIQILKNTMTPYYVLYVKDGKRLEACLTMIEFIRDHLVPKIYADDPHELRLAIETKNMVLNAEMKLRASLARTESRGTHYREDFPSRDDENWLVWITLKEEDGKMVVKKHPVPEEWHPSKEMPYDEKYAFRFPKDSTL